MNSPNPYHSQTSGLKPSQTTVPDAVGPEDDDVEATQRTVEWESKALMAGYGAFFIGAIKSFLLTDATGRFLMITAGLSAAGLLIVAIILISRMRRDRKASYRDLLILAVMAGICFALFRNSIAQQERWQHIRNRLDAMRERLSKEENRGTELDRVNKEEDRNSNKDQ